MSVLTQSFRYCLSVSGLGSALDCWDQPKMELRLLVPPGVFRPGVLGPLWPGTPPMDALLFTFSTCTSEERRWSVQRGRFRSDSRVDARGVLTLRAPPVEVLELSCEALRPPRVCLLVDFIMVPSALLSLCVRRLPSGRLSRARLSERLESLSAVSSRRQLRFQKNRGPNPTFPRSESRLNRHFCREARREISLLNGPDRKRGRRKYEIVADRG